MIHFSTKKVSLFQSEQHFRSLKAPALYEANACWYSTVALHGKEAYLTNSARRNRSGGTSSPIKISSFGRGSHFTKWVSLSCLSDQFLQLNRRCLHSAATFPPIKPSKFSFFEWLSPGGTNRRCSNSAATYSTMKNSSFCGFGFAFGKESSFTNWVSHACLKYQLLSANRQRFYGGCSFLPLKTSKFNSFGVSFCEKGSLRTFCDDTDQEDSKPEYRGPRIISQAQVALTEYLHSTARLNFLEAEHMSKNSPVFLDKLLKKVAKEEEIGRAVSRFLCYHPINEFEPFFESIGLKPSQFSPFLPRELMFLNDAVDMLENYRVLCNYGIARNNIGKIYMEATEVFRYELGVLRSKLLAYEKLGLTKTAVIKIIASSPSLLIGNDVSGEFVKVLEELEHIGIERDWIAEVLFEKSFYIWGRVLVFLHFVKDIGFSKEELGLLIRTHPDFLLDDSGKTAFLLLGFLLKLGTSRKDVCSLLAKFPRVRVGSFLKKLQQGLLFLIEIEMDTEGIQEILWTRVEFFGLHTLMKPSTLLTYLSTGKNRLRSLIKEDPDQLKKFVMGSKVGHLPKSRDFENSLKQKKGFLLHLGFVEGSKEIQKALSVFRGKGDELQDRLDFFVRYGLDKKDVFNMIKLAPHILNQKVDVLEKKINFLVHDLGFPLGSLVAFPSIMSYTGERVKLRLLMYNWLKVRGKAKHSLALSSVLACSDKAFAKRFINNHPQGPEVWENFKKTVHSS